MNDMIQLYHEKSRPEYCAKVGMVDEIVDMTELRPYIQAFTEAVYQNPKSICPMHQMVTPVRSASGTTRIRPDPD